jgi:hypothetical protein
VCSLVPYVMMSHGSMVQLSTRCVLLVSYVRMFHGYLIQFSTRCVWLVTFARMLPEYVTQLCMRYVWLVPYVRMFMGTWCSSLRGVFDLYLTVGCFTGPQHNNYINSYTFFAFEIWKLYPFIYYTVEVYSIQHYVIQFVSDAVFFSEFLHQKNWPTGYTM